MGENKIVRKESIASSEGCSNTFRAPAAGVVGASGGRNCGAGNKRKDDVANLKQRREDTRHRQVREQAGPRRVATAAGGGGREGCRAVR